MDAGAGGGAGAGAGLVLPPPPLESERSYTVSSTVSTASAVVGWNVFPDREAESEFGVGVGGQQLGGTTTMGVPTRTSTMMTSTLRPPPAAAAELGEG